MKYIFLLCTALFLCVSCSDDEQDRRDEEIIREYLETNAIEAIRDKSGLFYRIISEGSGNHPKLYTTVIVSYKGYLTNGEVFDQTTGSNTYESRLDFLIEGWQIGLQKIKPGGEMQLFIPSSLGYGDRLAGSIPPNSVLIFDIKLVGFKQ